MPHFDPLGESGGRVARHIDWVTSVSNDEVLVAPGLENIPAWFFARQCIIASKTCAHFFFGFSSSAVGFWFLALFLCVCCLLNACTDL
jgi:hypothetical protein